MRKYAKNIMQKIESLLQLTLLQIKMVIDIVGQTETRSLTHLAT
jgi:hypothetical protein